MFVWKKEQHLEVFCIENGFSPITFYFCSPPPSLAVLTDSRSEFVPSLRSFRSGNVGAHSINRRTHLLYGPVASAALVTALRLAQIEAQAQITLNQLKVLATITSANQCHLGNKLSTQPPQPALLNHILNIQQLSGVGLNTSSGNTNYRSPLQYQSRAMYHHQSQQQGPPQAFNNRPTRPSQQQQQQPVQQQQGRSATDILSQVLGFQFPPPTQLPDELESALAIRGSRDMDHRLMDHMNQPNPHQNQGSSEPSGYNSSPVGFPPDNQPVHQQAVDWSRYPPPSKLFSGQSPVSTHQAQRHQLPGAQQQQQQQRHQLPGAQQQQQQRHQLPGGQQPQSIQSWSASGSPSTQAPGSQSGGNGGRGGGGGMDIQGLYTPESAGSILASFGLSNEDLEVLSHYPDDQLTPDTLPFILRDIQINKSRSTQGMPPPASRSSPVRMGHSAASVPSLLRVTQTAGQVIDYGHASRATEEGGGRETFKREQLSNERTVKMVYSAPPPPPPPVATKHKSEAHERRHVRLEPAAESNKHGDLDYRRPSSENRKAKRSPTREFPSASKYLRPDRDYRRDGAEPRPTSETRSEKLSSRQPSSSASSSKPQSSSSSKRLPAPTMICDFSAEHPKVYPHTCSLCTVQCDRAEVSATMTSPVSTWAL